ncbi:RibD family protein [uncultured Proteiniphilum sp.]|uniref:RibD family protein n=1 Tax=uncultured Proteiniphilum sp. TaxID=497637 RepID=UPI0026157D9F|nr:RibD family protein [uncultured Proteiniphilum sp.]
MKPKVICHMMSSVDGRLVADRWTPPFNGMIQDKMYEPYYEISSELKARAWMIGNNTIQIDNQVEIFDYSKYVPANIFKTHIGKRETEKTCIIFDSKGKIIYPDDNINGDNVITVLSERVSDEYLSHLRQKGISYIFAGNDGYDLHKALETLYSEFGYDELLLDGGGVLNGKFLKEGLIDELSLLIYPGVDGLSGVSSIIEYKGKAGEFPATGQALQLLSVKQLRDGIVWLHYQFHRL